MSGRRGTLTVLIAEGHDASRDALARRLERRHYSVLQAVDGLQAVSMARASKPDLILMDLGLPGIDAWEATAQLTQSRETRDIPILVVSAQAMTRMRDQVLAAGGSDVDDDPVQLERLLDQMEAMLAKKASP